MNKLGLTTVKAPGRSMLRMIYGKMLFFTAALFLISIAQGAARQNGITLDVKNQQLGKVLKSIEQQAGYRFSYSPQVVPVNETVTLRVKDKPVHDVLNELLKSFDLSYKAASEKVIVIYKKEDGNRLATDDPVATADTAIVITGRIASSEGEALPGATISVKGTAVGAAADVKGVFSLRIPASKATLVASYMGYKSQEYKVNGTGRIEVRLIADSKVLNDVVVTGIVNRKKESFTGAAATFTANELRQVGNSNILQSLKTLDPSFIINDNNALGSNPNALPDVEVRGKSSMPSASLKDEFGADPNQPLFILDGFEATLQTIIDLDMNRIASVTLLKDAASTALYGAKAANGVVVVATKEPEPGAVRISYSGDFSLSAPMLQVYNMMNAAEKLAFEKLAGRYDANTQGVYTQITRDSIYNARLSAVESGVNTYWLSEPVRTGITQGHSIYADGGDGSMRYSAGVNYKTIGGVMKGSKRDTWGGNLKLSYRNKKLNIMENLFVNGAEGSESPYGSFATFVNANPYFKKRLADGSISRYLDETTDPNATDAEISTNPLYNAGLGNRSNNKSLGVQNNLSLIYDIYPGLRFQGSVQVGKTTATAISFTPPEHTSFDNRSVYERGRYTESQTSSFNYAVNAMLTYARVFRGVHSVNATARAEGQETNNRRTGFTAVGYPAGTNGNPSFSFGYDKLGKPAYSASRFRRNNLLASLNYAYDNRYMIDASLRYDGSTAFGSNKKYASFWSVGGGWNIHRETWFKQFSWLEFLKIRANVGLTGNQNFGSLRSTSVYNYESYVNLFGQALSLQAMGNPNLEWQNTLSSSGGIDFAFWKNRLNGSFNVYKKHTDPLIIMMDLPSSTGVTAYATNAGYLDAKGIEFNLKYSPVFRPKDRVIWTLGVFGSTVKSKYGGFGNKLATLNKQQELSKSLQRFSDGYSPDDIWAVTSVGIDPTTGREVFVDRFGQYSYTYSAADIVRVGNARPFVEGVVSSNLSLKGFTLGLNFRYRLGAEIFNNAVFEKVENITDGEILNNQDKRALYDRWKKPGDVAKFKAISLTGTTPMSSRFVQEENVIIGESLNMGYEFNNRRWMKKAGLTSLRLNAYMNDIFYFSTITRERGIDYPFAKSASFSVRAGF